MVERKGASTLIAVFIILVVSLIAVSWFRASTTSGSGVQQGIIQQSEINTFNHRFENTKLYLQNSLFYAGQKGTDRAGNYSGRRSKDQEARYWYCGGSKQVPEIDMVRNASSNFTLEYMEERFEEMHGIRDNTVYRIGEASCLDTGYNELPASEYSDNFTQAVQIESINLSRQSGGLKKSESDVTLSKDIKYNRYWYIYSTLKKWVNQENLRDDVKDELAQVKDQGSRSNSMCITGPSECTYPDPKMCSDHGTLMDRAVVDGLSEEKDILESNEQYFNGTGVECAFTSNRKNGNQFPGHSVTVQESENPVNVSDGGTCGCEQYNASEEPRHCVEPKWDYQCQKNWQLAIDSKIDTSLTCRDTKFRNVPNSSLGNLKWKIDLSFRVGESSASGGSYSCSTDPYSTLPASIRSCSYTGTASTCQTEVETVE